MSVTMNGKHLSRFVSDNEFSAIFPQVALAHETLHSKTGPGSDFLGWVDLPENYDKERICPHQGCGREDTEKQPGAGGHRHRRQLSWRARAVIEALKGSLSQRDVQGHAADFSL